MRRRSILNEHGHLVGAAETKDAVGVATPAGQLDLDPGDLPLDGSYRWDPKHGAFVPLGWGRGFAPDRGPHPETLVLHHLIRDVERAGVDVKKEVREWAEWYEKRQLNRDELAIGRQRRRR